MMMTYGPNISDQLISLCWSWIKILGKFGEWILREWAIRISGNVLCGKLMNMGKLLEKTLVRLHAGHSYTNLVVWQAKRVICKLPFEPNSGRVFGLTLWSPKLPESWDLICRTTACARGNKWRTRRDPSGSRLCDHSNLERPQHGWSFRKLFNAITH